MKAWNWYFNAVRHTRSDRAFKAGEIEASYRGIRLISGNKHMDIDLTMQETDDLIKQLVNMQKVKLSEPLF